MLINQWSINILLINWIDLIFCRLLIKPKWESKVEINPTWFNDGGWTLDLPPPPMLSMFNQGWGRWGSKKLFCKFHLWLRGLPTTISPPPLQNCKQPTPLKTSLSYTPLLLPLSYLLTPCHMSFRHLSISYYRYNNKFPRQQLINRYTNKSFPPT